MSKKVNIFNKNYPWLDHGRILRFPEHKCVGFLLMTWYKDHGPSVRLLTDCFLCSFFSAGFVNNEDSIVDCVGIIHHWYIICWGQLDSEGLVKTSFQWIYEE